MITETSTKCSNRGNFVTTYGGTFAPILFGLTGAILLSLYAFKMHRHPISDDVEHWGQFGDFIGGVMNPLIGLVSLLAILRSLDAIKVSKKNSEAFAIQFCLGILNENGNKQKLQAFHNILVGYIDAHQPETKLDDWIDQNKEMVSYLFSLRDAIVFVVEAQGLNYYDGRLRAIWSWEFGVLDKAFMFKKEGTLSLV